MKHELTDARDGRRSLRITAEWDEVAADYEDVCAGYARATTRGFRAGKAPRAVIERRFRNQLRDDFTIRCGRRLARQALRDRNLRAAGAIAVVDIRLEPRREFAFTAECVPIPDLELPDRAGVPPVDGSDDERRDAISEWLLARTAWEVPEPLVREECQRGETGDLVRGSDAWRAAARRVKLTVILEQIAEAEGIEVDEREVDARIARMAAESGVPPDALRRELGEDGVGRLQSLLHAEQTLAHLLATAAPPAATGAEEPEREGHRTAEVAGGSSGQAGGGGKPGST